MVRLVERLQREMEREQDRFDQINQQVEGPDSNEEVEQLTAELLLAQSRLATLCAKNMKCFEHDRSSTQPNENVVSFITPMHSTYRVVVFVFVRRLA